MTTTVCPICFSTSLSEFNTRPHAYCAKCGSLERGRLVWMVASRLGLLRPGVNFLNLAPEPFMLSYGRRIIGESLVAGDFSPQNFNASAGPIIRVDLCEDRLPFDDNSLDVIMHNHVLEHVCCSVPQVIQKLNRLLKPGGYHLISIPLFPGRKSEEDLSEISPDEKKRRFGQNDHVRLFGDDFMEFFRAGGIATGLLDLQGLFFPHELETWGIPAETLARPSGHTIFAWRKPEPSHG
ncbi:MAG: class I SAM-dependent methyltransferase [Hyphomonas sp.]